MMVWEFKSTIMVEENLDEMFWARPNGRPNTKLLQKGKEWWLKQGSNILGAIRREQECW
jgi:hypothetical protein